MPEQFGAYEIERRIGAGGMAEVFLAHRRGPEGFAKRVALKRVLPAYNEDAEFVRLFVDEARLAARLDHPHVASLHDFGEVDGAWYMAMEYVEGADLRTVLAGLAQLGQPLPTDLVLLVAVDLASALLYAHELELDGRPASVVHRDVTPSNILVSVDGAIRLADFGIAKAATHGHHTRTGIVKGKVPYMPPEQALGQAMDHRVDLFAMGVVLYECIAGKRPYDGATELDTLQRISKGVHKPLLEVAPHAPPALAAAIERLIRPEPEARFACAADVLDALATTPPPTNARRLLGNLVKRVQKELPPVVQARPRPTATPRRPRAAQADEGTRPMKAQAAARTQPDEPTAAMPRAASADVGQPPARADAETFVVAAPREPTVRAGAQRSRGGWLVASAVLVLSAVAGAMLVAVIGPGADRVDAPAHAAKSPPPELQAALPIAIAARAEARPTQPPIEIAVSDVAREEPRGAAETTSTELVGARASSASPHEGGTHGETQDARVASAEGTPEAPRLGRVQIVALPVGAVSIDGRPHGSSPVSASLRPGRHTIVVQNGEREESRTVQLVAGATERVVFRFPMSE